MFLQTGATTLFYNSDDMFADCPALALQEGTFLTLALNEDCVTMRRNGKFVLTAKLPVRFRRDKNLYCAAVMDQHCDIVPCWTITD